MKRFLIIYNASAEATASMADTTPEQKEEGMKIWYKWKDSMGDKLIDFGAPLTGGQRINTDGSVQDTSNGVAGYSIIQAKDMDQAKSILKEHPHLQWANGCDIEIYECIEM